MKCGERIFDFPSVYNRQRILVVIGRRLEDVLILLLNLVRKVKFPLVPRNLFSFSGGFLILLIPLDTQIYMCIGVAIKW